MHMKINLTRMTADAMQLTEEVTTRWTSRIAGSPACLACGDYLLDTFTRDYDGAEKQEFKVHPASFLGYMKICVVLYFIALIAFLFHQLLVAAVVSSIPIIITVTHFFYFKEVIDFLYPEKLGQNIMGTIEPSGEVKRQVIISGHHDSAHIFNFLENDPDSFGRKTQLSIGGIFGLAIATWLTWSLSLMGISILIPYYGFAAVFVFLSIYVYQLWHFHDEQGTPGAGDNMICTAIAMEVGKHFKSIKGDPSGLKHTRIIVTSWDAEEAGLRGARAYVKANKQELHDVKTYNFNLECMYDHAELGFLTSDLNSFVPMSSQMVDECVDVAASIGYSMKKNPFPLLAGGTDAAEFAKAGIEATTLAAMSWTERGEGIAYHTTSDTIDAVDPIAVSRSIETAIHYIRRKDEQITA